jgi:hypothetical protein
VESLFEGVPLASGVMFMVDGDLPLEFVRDLACGGGAFRDAFPALEDRIVLDVRRIISQLAAPTSPPPSRSLTTPRYSRK